MTPEYFRDQNGKVIRFSDLQIASQRERDASYRRVLQERVSTIEAGGVPDGWTSCDPDEKDSRAGTGVYGFEHQGD